MNSADEVAYIKRLFPRLGDIGATSIRESVIEAFLAVWHQSKWARIELVPFSPEVPLSRCSLAQHINLVTDAAVSLGRLLHSVLNVSVDFDVLIAGGLVHDISKLVEFEPLPEGACRSQLGRELTHGTYGAHACLNAGVPPAIVHIISSHTPHTDLVPASLEAIIVAYADGLAADAVYHGTDHALLLEKHKG